MTKYTATGVLLLSVWNLNKEINKILISWTSAHFLMLSPEYLSLKQKQLFSKNEQLSSSVVFNNGRVGYDLYG